MDTKKSYNWQMVRAFLCIAVVQIHCDSEIDLNLWNPDSIYYLFVRNIINFPVAAFFFISGYFDSYEIGGGGYAVYLKKRVKRLLVPYIFYSYIYMVLNCIFLDGTLSMGEVVKNIIMGSAASPLYYCVVLIEFTILTPILHKLKKSKKLRLLPFMISIAIIAIGYFLMIGKNMNLWRFIKLTPIWIMFFYAGILVKFNETRIQAILAKKKVGCKLVITLIIIFIFEIIETIVMTNANCSDFAYSQMRVTGFLYAGCVCAIIIWLVLCNKLTKRYDLLVDIGDCSFGIYFIHYAFIMLYNYFFAEYVSLLDCLFIERVVQFSFSFILSYVMCNILRKFIKSKIIGNILGVK